ncbi:MAG TPA: hypothetical protein VGG16_04690 [Streptosporangiaceae bacterium]
MSATRRLRMASLGVISTLILEFIFGAIHGVYGPYPSPGKSLGLFSNGWIALHVIVAILLLISAIVLVIRAVSARQRLVLWTSVAGLIAIIAAGGSGIGYAHDGAHGSALGMLLAFAIAMACYVVNLVVLPSGPGES